MIKKFNIRVYGILEHEAKLLVLKEAFNGQSILKLPGGGLEFGEGTVDCLKREFLEELNLKITGSEHFYTQEEFKVSRINSSEQLLLIYYKVSVENLNDLKLNDQTLQNFYWLKLDSTLASKMYLPIDKLVIKSLYQIYLKTRQ